MITASEIVQIVYARNLRSEHIKQSDIDVATAVYVDAYISNYSGATAFISSYVKPVIAYGVATDIFHRLTTEITDRGVVELSSTGARVASLEGQAKTLQEFETVRDRLIDQMVDAAPAAGADVLYTGDAYSRVSFTGLEKMERL